MQHLQFSSKQVCRSNLKRKICLGENEYCRELCVNDNPLFGLCNQHFPCKLSLQWEIDRRTVGLKRLLQLPAQTSLTCNSFVPPVNILIAVRHLPPGSHLVIPLVGQRENVKNGSQLVPCPALPSSFACCGFFIFVFFSRIKTVEWGWVGEAQLTFVFRE